MHYVSYINSSIFLGLSIWLLGFALMTAGWLVDVLFESYGTIPAKVLYKTGAIIVAVPVISLLWKVSRLLYRYRIEIVFFIREMAQEIESIMNSF